MLRCSCAGPKGIARIPVLILVIGYALLADLQVVKASDACLPALRLPIDCTIGTDCSIQNYFDHDPGPGFRDYACGSLGYDGHDGTDLRVPSLVPMGQGVAVFAAAPGVVRATRDGMADVSVRTLGREAIRGREAGNGVVLRHGPDWETQYSHLRRGSVRVRPGERVDAGDVLGLVGLSGNTEFPHLHFEVRYQGRPVDPFVGPGPLEDCGKGARPLWDKRVLRQLAYRPTGLLQAGFSEGAPDRAVVEAGEAARSSLVRDASAMVFWVEIYGAQRGDRESIRIIAPDGTVIAQKRGEIERNKAQWLSFAGRKRRGDAWSVGTYRAHYQLRRGNSESEQNVIDLTRTIEVE